MLKWFSKKSPPKEKSAATHLTNDERRCAIAITYVAQFAIFHDDFFKALDLFDKNFLVSMPDSHLGHKRFFDKNAHLAIWIGNDNCRVQCIGDQLDQFVSPLQLALTVTGGSAVIEKKKDDEYIGLLIKDGKDYSIQALLDKSDKLPMMTINISRVCI